MVRPVEKKDRSIFLELTAEFWNTPAVHTKIPSVYHEKTFDLIMKGTPYLAAYLISYNETVVGYGLLSFTYSNEAGGMVVWLEEVYIREAYRGRGLGNEYLRFISDKYRETAAWLRLEISPENNKAKKLYEKFDYRPMPYHPYYKVL
jgi:ribosomal protein S18 acetylase RimI-like enzyme